MEKERENVSGTNPKQQSKGGKTSGRTRPKKSKSDEAGKAKATVKQKTRKNEQRTQKMTGKGQTRRRPENKNNSVQKTGGHKWPVRWSTPSRSSQKQDRDPIKAGANMNKRGSRCKTEGKTPLSTPERARK